MTRKGHKLDKFDAPQPARKAASTSPWAGYLRCDESGVDAGRAGRDMDDLPALEVCEGRRLVIQDSAHRARRRKSEDPNYTPPPPRIYKTPDAKREKAREYARQRRVRERKQAKTAPCTHCGTVVRITAKATYVEQVYCRAPDCRLAYARAYEARKRRERREAKAPCRYCGAERVRGRGDVAVPSCASDECARKAKSERQKARRAKPKPTKPEKPQRTSTCAHCGVVFGCIMSTARYCTPTCRYRHTTTYVPVTPSTDTL